VYTTAGEDVSNPPAVDDEIGVDAFQEWEGIPIWDGLSVADFFEEPAGLVLTLDEELEKEELKTGVGVVA
jgi:hypothetical protein